VLDTIAQLLIFGFRPYPPAGVPPWPFGSVGRGSDPRLIRDTN
jgi:hypothetical protein